MHTLSGREFQIGLTMSGAISAGAYTAGVLDFLTEALDAWEEARKGPDGDAVPNHRVGIKVMAGASAGGITGAIAAIALVDGAPGGGRRPPGAYERSGFTYRYYLPKLYETWVVKPTFVAEDKNALDFLSSSDLTAPQTAESFVGTSKVPSSARPQKGAVISVLNTQLLDDIARAALKIERLLDPPCPYIAEKLHVYLTLSNLRGVPYRVPFRGGDYHMIAHGDRVHYCVTGVGSWSASSLFADSDKKRLLDAKTLIAPADQPPADWKDYAICALASSAFPVGLSPRLIHTTTGAAGPDDNSDEYDRRLIPEADLVADSRIAPSWNPPPPGPWVYWFATSDGGIIDNDPFEYAYFSLKDGTQMASLSAPIEVRPDKANRAVVMISPFPEEKPILPEGRPALDIVALYRALMPALQDQVRFKPSQLALALNEKDGSRYLIGPRRDGARFTIASGLLNGFGGFVARTFRDFDFQLGRRNCQRFLQTAFAVPADNPIVRDWASHVDRERFRAPKSDPNEEPTYVLIPLYGTAAAEVKLPPWPQISQGDFDTLQQRIGKRFDAVAPSLTRQNVRGLLGLLLRFALMPGPNLVVSLIRDKLLKFVKWTILSDLVRRDQIAGWALPENTGLEPGDLRLVIAELLNPQFDFRSAKGVAHSIGPLVKTLIEPNAIEAALQTLTGAEGKPFQVWQAGWKAETEAGPVSLFTAAARKPWWADPLTGGRYLAPLIQPTTDVAGA